MRNNNSSIIKKLTKRSLFANKKRNFFITLAILLTTLLISFVFSIGMSILDSLNIQQVRLMGTIAHASVSHLSNTQLEQLRKLDYIEKVGIGNNVALVKNTPEMGDANLSLHYFDKTEWEELRTPAHTDIFGTYPQKEDEIMIPLWILERMGITDPVVGMKIPLSYLLSSGNSNSMKQLSGDFTLSGWFTSFMQIRSGNIGSIFVSEEFSRKCGKTLYSDGAATVLFDDDSKILEYCEQLEKDLSLSGNQKVNPVPMYEVDTAAKLSNIIAFSLVIVFLIFMGYLLIYNVLYISVSKDVRFYGLLKTLGTTPRQIRRMVLGQVSWLCMIGIPLGSLLAALLSFAITPMAIKSFSSMSAGTVISFSPLIYIGAMFFAFLTAIMGAVKPAKKAAGISPIEAQKYTGLQITKTCITSSTHGSPFKMAFRNMFRDRKRAYIVLISLFLGITTFLAITTLVTSMDTDNYVASYFKEDFKIKNNTREYFGDKKHKFDDDFLSKIQSLTHLENLNITKKELVKITYSTEVFGKYTAQFLEKNAESGIKEEDLKNDFGGLLIGMDSKELESHNKTFKNPIDVEAFERGEFALISTNNPELFNIGDQIDILNDINSKSLQLPIGGFVPLFFKGIGYSMSPTIFISNTIMDQLYEDPIISELTFNVIDGYEEQVLDQLKKWMDGDNEMSRISALEAQEHMKDSKLLLYILGGGIALVLGIIGILNFINVMSVGIMVRKHELATLEGIGMSKKQIRSMLISEGLYYAIITLASVLTIGNLFTYGIFKLFQQEATYAIFTYPFVPIIIASLVILIICILTPEMAYRNINKSTIVERLKDME